MFVDGDTIVARATPPGRGALAIIRLSGGDAWALVGRLFRAPAEPASRVARVGDLTDAGGDVIDRAVCVLWRGPASYTGEDMAELTVHAGPAVVEAALDAFLTAGARMAEPGEFTWRAVRDGKLDLSQAEAVADLAAARTAGARRDALRRLGGELSGRVNGVRAAVVRARAEVEAALDFGVEVEAAAVANLVGHAAEDAGALVAAGRDREALTQGALVALAGPGNAGKSTLFNALAGEERAIVHEEPGTTRDVIETSVVLDGALVRLVDTAGLAEDEGDAARAPVEQEGIRRARRVLDEAAVVLWLDDISLPPPAGEPPVDGERLIRLASKADLAAHKGWRAGRDERIIKVSAKTAKGMAALKAALVARLGDGGGNDALSLSHRERRLLAAAAAHMEAAGAGLRARGVDEVAAEELRLAAEAVAKVLGAADVEELYDDIFQRFCLGK